MKTEYVALNLDLPKGVKVKQYEHLAEISKDAGSEAKVVDIVNKYLRQKGPLVKARDFLATECEKRSTFPAKTKTVETTADDGTKSTSTVWEETENKYLERFVAAVTKAEFTVDGVEPTEVSAYQYLQGIADEKEFECNAAVVERESKPKTPPKYALDAADTIIKNGSMAKWADKFKKAGIEHADFQTGNPEADRAALAWAVKEREDRKAKTEYV